jgi:hypothetical protein
MRARGGQQVGAFVGEEGGGGGGGVARRGEGIVDGSGSGLSGDPETLMQELVTMAQRYLLPAALIRRVRD